MRDQYMRVGHGFLLVYSMTSRESFQHIQTLRTQILKVKDATEFPMVLVAAKADLTSEREVMILNIY